MTLPSPNGQKPNAASLLRAQPNPARGVRSRTPIPARADGRLLRDPKGSAPPRDGGRLAGRQVRAAEQLHGLHHRRVTPAAILFIQPTTMWTRKEYSPSCASRRCCATARHCGRRVADAEEPRQLTTRFCQKAYPGGILTMCGSTEAHALASKPIRYVFGDERDRWAASAGNRGRPVGAGNGPADHVLQCEGRRGIDPDRSRAPAPSQAAYATGTMERWMSSQMPALQASTTKSSWADLRYEYDETGIVAHMRRPTRSGRCTGTSAPAAGAFPAMKTDDETRPGQVGCGEPGRLRPTATAVLSG